MDYTVELTLHTERAVTKKMLFDVAAIGGAAVGKGRHLETTLSVTDVDDWLTAADRAIKVIGEHVSGTILAVDVMTTDEADRRLNERPELVGVAEIAEILDVTKQRASVITQRNDFPAPLARLASGPVWRAGAVASFKTTWRRQPGRPRTPPEA